jgi:hypothetical protein
MHLSPACPSRRARVSMPLWYRRESSTEPELSTNPLQRGIHRASRHWRYAGAPPTPLSACRVPRLESDALCIRRLPLTDPRISAAVAPQRMFEGASAFNQPLATWDISRVRFLYVRRRSARSSRSLSRVRPASRLMRNAQPPLGADGAPAGVYRRGPAENFPKRRRVQPAPRDVGHLARHNHGGTPPLGPLLCRVVVCLAARLMRAVPTRGRLPLRHRS